MNINRFLMAPVLVLLVLLALPLFAAPPGLDQTLDDLDGTPVELNDYAGEKLTVLDFWATWCGPCIRSIPELIKISADYEEKGVAIVGINEDGPRNLSKVKPFVKSRRIPYPVLADQNGDLMEALDVSALPTLLILNAEGRELFRHEGFHQGDELKIREKLDVFVETGSEP